MSEPRSDSPDLYGQLCRQLLESFGLQFEPDGKQIATAVRARLEFLGLDLANYKDLLAGPTAAEELFQLAGELSLGQMAFNDEHLLEVFQRFFQPLLRSRLANRPEGTKPILRIWSAGCGSGAQIYSVLLQLAKLTSLSAWDLRILATDISHRWLVQAKAAAFSASQVRRVDQDDLQNYFVAQTKAPEGPDRWVLSDEIRLLVDFRPHNMLAPEIPADADGQFNLILCRAMLKQLSPQAKTQVLSKLSRALSPDGLLIVPATESSGLDHPLLQPASEEFGSVLRRRAARAKQMPAEMSGPQLVPELSALRGKLRRIYLPTSARSAPSTRKPPASVVDDRAIAAEFLQRAEQLAEDFQFPQALLACRRARQLDEFNLAAHFMTGVIARRMDRLDEAVEAFERACYLDKNLEMAHFLLGHIYQETDRPSLARHRYDQALECLADKSADETVLFADGISVPVLRELCVAGKDALSEIAVGGI